MIVEVLDALRALGNRPAVVSGTQVTSGTQLAAMTTRTACGLRAEGITAGSRIAVAAQPAVSTLAVLLAARYLGACVVLADPRVGADLLVRRMAQARPDLLVTSPLVRVAAGWGRPVARWRGIDIPDLRQLAPRHRDVHALQHTGQPPGPAPEQGDAVMIFTSGTTAAPKAVVHSAQSLAACLAGAARLVGPRPGLPVLAGTFFAIVPALANGVCVHLPGRSPRTFARQTRAQTYQAVYSTPPVWRAALRHGARPSGVAFAGSAPVTVGLLDDLVRAGARDAVGVYALTEALPVAAVTAQDKRAYDGPGDLVGTASPDVRMRLNDDGVLELAGPIVAPRYLGEPEHDWVSTGDRARLDGGQVVLTGRAKDMIIRDAENIYPGLYEPALQVDGVALALLVGVPDPDRGEQVVACVELAAGARPRDVSARLRRVFATMGAARPDRVCVLTIPLSARSGKPDRDATRRAVLARTR